jgi:hypothetical protein
LAVWLDSCAASAVTRPRELDATAALLTDAQALQAEDAEFTELPEQAAPALAPP